MEIGITRQLGWGALVGALCGVSSGGFLWLLDWATATREGHPQLVFLLPVAGLLVGWGYGWLGASIRGGSNLVLRAIYGSDARLPRRMAPLVLVGSVLTHLFGGSAGREGAAVQMGAGLADSVAGLRRASPALRRLLLIAGVSGGFGAVFGTPIAGTFFSLELLYVGAIERSALVPALSAALVGDWVTRGLGIGHTHYPAASWLALDPLTLGRLLLLGLACGLVARLFVTVTHELKGWLERRIPALSLRMGLGGAVVLGLWLWVGTSDYLGLGVPVIVRAFHDPGLPWETFALKLLFTAVTIASGFLGGEVTPLFLIGAALGNLLGPLLGLPLGLSAGLGMAAVFGAAARTPLALSLMAVELLGAEVLPHVVVVTVAASLVMGPRGLYTAQRRAEAGARAGG